MQKIKSSKYFPKTLRSASALGFSVVLVGCVNWKDGKYRPSLPEYTRLPFVDQTWANAGHPHALTLDDYKDSLRIILRDVMESLEEKNDQTWSNGLTTLLGTTGAAIGALAGKVGLTNTGIGVAAGGQIAQSHYTPEAVRDLHLDAHRKLACISTEIGNLSEFQRRWALLSATPEGRLASSEALFTISHAVDGVLADYRQRLLDRSPPSQSTQDMVRFLDAYKAQAVSAERAASAAKASADAAAANPDVPVDPTLTKGVEKPKGKATGSQSVESAQSPQITASSPQPVASTPKAHASKANASGSAAPVVSRTTEGPFETRGKYPEDRMEPAERAQYLVAGNRYAVRFVTLSTRLEACRRLGAP